VNSIQEKLMTTNRTLLALVFAAAAIVAPALHAASDTVTIGSVQAAGNTVDVPVYIRDTAGTPLGIDQPAGSRIQSFSMKVTYSPASSVQSISFSRAGITANLTPSFESSPSTATTVSLLDTFQESTNLIPFTSNAQQPGNQVAHLSVTLSSSAAPGSTISLTLDPSTTQLTDQGGSAATKESSGNGLLTLVNGTITVPNVTVSFSPTSLTLTAGNNGSLTLSMSAAVGSTTTVTLTSSAPSVATVPSSVDIAAGTRSKIIAVNALAVGSAHITATLPASLGSGTASANVSVVAPTVCNTPVAPVISGPSAAEVSADYVISWLAVNDTTEYFVDEATDAGFTAVTTTTVTGTSATFNHGTNNVRYFYRVRAHNHAGSCDLTSPNSNVVSVLIGHEPVPPMRVLTVVGSTPAAFGSYFKTSLQLYNPYDDAVSGKIVFHTAQTSGSASDPSLAFSIQPKKTLAYADLLPAMGIPTGLGTADLVADAGSLLPIAVARVFSDNGSLGTNGLTEEPLASTDALQVGQTGALLAPADVLKFRLNIGVRTLDQHTAVTITVRDKDGNVVKEVAPAYDPTYFAQKGSTEVLGGYALTGGETISFTVTEGSLIVYGATTDNTSADPSVQFARPIQ